MADISGLTACSTWSTKFGSRHELQIGAALSTDDPDERDRNRPTIEVNTNDQTGRLIASSVLESPFAISRLRDAESIAAIAANEFLDVAAELRFRLNERERARDRNICVSSVSFREAHERQVSVRSTLLIEYTPCDGTDPGCDDVVGLMINDAVQQLRQALAQDLAQYIQGV